MMNLKHFLGLVVGVAFLAATGAEAGARRGVQAVLLENWQPSSVDSLIGIVNRAPGEIEVALAPWQFNSRNTFAQTRRLIMGVCGAGKSLVVTIHLSFHRDDQNDEGTIKQRARHFDAFAKEMETAYPGKIHFIVTPQLEDEWGDTTGEKMLKMVAGELGSDTIRLRRSVTPDHGTAAQKEIIVNHKKFVVEREIHGTTDKAAGYEAFSNDGDFVWLADHAWDHNGRKVHEGSHSFGGDHESGGSSKDFTAFAQRPAHDVKIVLLWRPAYNGAIVWTNPIESVAADGTVTYRPTPKTTVRTNFPAMDEQEKLLLERFCGIRE